MRPVRSGPTAGAASPVPLRRARVGRRRRHIPRLRGRQIGALRERDQRRTRWCTRANCRLVDRYYSEVLFSVIQECGSGIRGIMSLAFPFPYHFRARENRLDRHDPYPVIVIVIVCIAAVCVGVVSPKTSPAVAQCASALQVLAAPACLSLSDGIPVCPSLTVSIPGCPLLNDSIPDWRPLTAVSPSVRP